MLSPVARRNQDLAERIAQAEAGATLELAAGRWVLDGSVTIDKNLVLRGKGPKATVVTGKSDDDWLLVARGATLVASGISFSRTGNAADADVLSVKGRAELSSCRLQGATKAGDRGGSGIRACDKASVVLVDTDVRKCAFAAIVAMGNARVEVSGGELIGQQAGVIAWGSPKLALERARISGRAAAGVELSQRAVLEKLVDCEVRGAKAAVALSGDARAALAGNTLTSRMHGISLAGRSSATLDGDIAGRCGDSGIRVVDRGELSGRDVKVEAGAKYGVHAVDYAKVSLVDSTVANARLVGVAAFGKARVTLTGGSVTSSKKYDLHAEDRARIELARS